MKLTKKKYGMFFDLIRKYYWNENLSKYRLEWFDSLYYFTKKNDLDWLYIKSLKNQKNSICEKYKKLKKSYIKNVKKINEMNKLNEFEYVLIKSCRNYDYLDDDLDCVIRLKNKDIDKFFRKKGFEQYMFSFREPRKLGYKIYNEPVYLHFHKHVSWNGILFIPFNDLNEKKRREKLFDIPVNVPSPEHEIIINFLHSFFENFEIKLGDLLELSLNIKNNNIDWQLIYRYVNSKNIYYPFKYYMHIYSLFEECILCKSHNFEKEKEFQLDEDLTFPHLYPIKVLSKGRYNKIKSDIFTLDWKSTIEDIYAFVFDIPFYVKKII